MHCLNASSQRHAVHLLKLSFVIYSVCISKLQYFYLDFVFQKLTLCKINLSAFLTSKYDDDMMIIYKSFLNTH